MISVIVPVYNCEQYLEQCIDSILAQTYSDLEILLVDDGSTDHTGKICDAYAAFDSRIKVIHKKNKGAASARKAGFEKALGEYIAFVDGDDWIEPDMYEKLLLPFSTSNVDIVLCGRFEDTGDKSVQKRHSFPPGIYDKKALAVNVYPEMISRGTFFEMGISGFMWDKLFRREHLENFLMAVDDRVTIGEDALCAYPALLHAEGIAILDDCLYHYRQNSVSITKKKEDRELARQRFHILYQTGLRTFEQGAAVYDMRKQWTEFVLFLMIPRADMLFEEIEALSYLFPYPDVERGSNIILYGMGTYGQHLYRFLKESGFCHVVACADINHAEMRKQGMNVISPEAIADCGCDSIVVACTYGQVTKAIVRELRERFPEKKIHVIDERLICSESVLRAFGLQKNCINRER